MEGYFDREGLADFLEESTRTVARRDAKREGPPRVKIGRKWWYPADLAKKWLEAQIEHQCNAPKVDP